MDSLFAPADLPPPPEKPKRPRKPRKRAATAAPAAPAASGSAASPSVPDGTAPAAAPRPGVLGTGEAPAPAPAPLPAEEVRQSTVSALRPARDRSRAPQLEKSIKEEALELFRKGMTAGEVARTLMLPMSAVRGWEDLYLKGSLMKFGRDREEDAVRTIVEPPLFSGKRP